jgi:hypothetical protein
MIGSPIQSEVVVTSFNLGRAYYQARLSIPCRNNHNRRNLIISIIMKTFVFLALFFLSSSATAYSIKSFSTPSPSPVVNRRTIFQSVAYGGALVAAVLVTDAAPAYAALDSCPKGSNNCLTTLWTPPAGTDASAAAAILKKVIESYPVDGQNKVDLGGWTIVDDSFSPGKVASIEYKSGIGNFAKFFNGGKPFVDDLKLEIGTAGVVQVRSSSRIGDSDLGVNQKRLVYLADKLRGEGWTAPDPKY